MTDQITSIHPYFPGRTLPTGMEGEGSPFNVVACRVGGNGSSADWWHGPGQYDFTTLDWTISSLMKEFPTSMIGLYLWCHPGPWYSEMFPERMAMDQDGNICKGYYVSMVSFSDKDMQDDTLNAVAALVDHCEKYFGSRIVLYNLMGGISCEWQGWNCHSANFSDYSPASLRDFRRYAAERGVPLVFLCGEDKDAPQYEGLPNGVGQFWQCPQCSHEQMEKP